MRLLSIFALLFLISWFLHKGVEEQPAPEPKTGQAGENVTDVPSVAAAAPEPAEVEEFSSLIFDLPYPVKHFDFEQESAFSNIEQEIKNLIVGGNDDSFKKINHFCAIGYEFPPVKVVGRKNAARRNAAAKKREVIVYWGEIGTLFRWKGGIPKDANQDFYAARSLFYSDRLPVDPAPNNTGIETTGPSIAGSLKARAENVVTDCKKHGKSYMIEPFAPPPRGFRQPERRLSAPVAAVYPQKNNPHGDRYVG
jgi:hypothetical protein